MKKLTMWWQNHLTAHISAGILPGDKTYIGSKVLCRGKTTEIPHFCQDRKGCNCFDTNKTRQLMNIFSVGIFGGYFFDPLVQAFNFSGKIVICHEILFEDLLIKTFRFQ